MFWAILACGGPAHAEVYKWTDAQGKVHYTDRPAQADTPRLKGVSTGQAATTQQATQSLNARDQEYQKRRKEAEDARAKAEKEAEQARLQRENCEKARNNLSALQNTPRVFSTNAAGQRVYLDEAGRASALANSQKAVSEFCK